MKAEYAEFIQKYLFRAHHVRLYVRRQERSGSAHGESSYLPAGRRKAEGERMYTRTPVDEWTGGK